MRDRHRVLCPEAAVRIILGGCRIHLFPLFRWFCRQNVYHVIVRRIDVRFGRRYGPIYGVLSIVRLDLFIALRTWRNIAV